jgi:hypothetical protein
LWHVFESGKIQPQEGDVRKQTIATIAFAMLGLFMAGCSSSNSNSGNINGNWSASLTNADGSPSYAFTTTFTDAGSGGVAVTNFSFTSNDHCFAGDTTSETGSFGFSGNLNGNVTGTFGMNITTEFPNGATQNVLALQGTVSGSTISGTWTLTGGCTGAGTFKITKP